MTNPGAPNSTVWTPKSLQRLGELWLAGRSYREIAAELGKDISPNVIAGKLHRLKATGELPQQRHAGAKSITVEPNKIFWTPERDDRLRALFADGVSADLIAERFGTTACGIRGRCKRIGLKRGRSYPKVRRAAAATPQAVTLRQPEPIVFAPPPPPPPTDAGPEPLNLGFLEINGHNCRWPTGGDGAGMLFCGHPTKTNRSFCSHHAEIAYRKAPDVR